MTKGCHSSRQLKLWDNWRVEEALQRSGGGFFDDFVCCILFLSGAVVRLIRH